MRQEFSARVERDAEARANGQCEGCGGMLKGKFFFDHIKADGLSGEPTLENCQVLCARCHLDKTMDIDMPQMRSADRKAKLRARLPVAAGLTEMQRRFKDE